MSSSGRSHIRWLLIIWLFLLSAISFLDRVNISIAGSFLAEEYHLSQVRLGWVFSAFLLGYALFQTPGGWLADRFGPRRVLAGGVVWWGVFTALTAALPTKIAGAVWYWIARDKPEQHPQVSPSELSFIQKNRTQTLALGSVSQTSRRPDEN